MKRLLSIELQKIWKNRASKILIITYFGLLSLLALLSIIKFDFGPFHIDASQQGIFNFPYIWHLNSYIADYFSFFLAIIIVSMMANEYSYGTLKQNLIDGLSKKEFITSKFITVIFLSALATFFVFTISLVLGLVYSTYTEFGIIFSQMEYLLAFLVKLISFFSFCLFLGIFIKRSAFALGFLILWYFIEKISFGILKYEVFNKSPKVDTIYNFFPLESMSNLLIEPYSRLSVIKAIGTKVGIENSKDYSVHWYSIVIALVWTSIFIYGSFYVLKKRDL